MTQEFVIKSGLLTEAYDRPIRLADGSLAKKGIIAKTQNVAMTIGSHQEDIKFEVSNLGKEDIILGRPWLSKHNPHVDWRNGTVTLTCCGISEVSDIAQLDSDELEVGIYGIEQAPEEFKRMVEELLPKEYQEFSELFIPRPAESALPEHKEWDHEIILKEGMEPSYGPIYATSPARDEIVRE